MRRGNSDYGHIINSFHAGVIFSSWSLFAYYNQRADLQLLFPDLLTQSDGAVLFRSPPPGGVKKRKPRPEPLVIPPNVAAIQSRLRSPRIWEPGENPG